MKTFTKEEVEAFGLDDDFGWEEEGCKFIEARVSELATLGIGTCCGKVGNLTFKALAEKGYQHRIVRGWLGGTPASMNGMVHIRMQTEKSSLKVQHIADEAHGSLRYDGPSYAFEGFMVFEIE